MQKGTPEQRNDETASGIQRTPVNLEQQQQRAQEPHGTGKVARNVDRTGLQLEQQQREEANVAEVQQQPPAVPDFDPQNLRAEMDQALNYVQEIQTTYSDRPHVHEQFLQTMMQHKYLELDTPTVLARIRQLFKGNPRLIEGFNQFLPPDSRPSM